MATTVSSSTDAMTQRLENILSLHFPFIGQISKLSKEIQQVLLPILRSIDDSHDGKPSSAHAMFPCRAGLTTMQAIIVVYFLLHASTKKTMYIQYDLSLQKCISSCVDLPCDIRFLMHNRCIINKEKNIRVYFQQLTFQDSSENAIYMVPNYNLLDHKHVEYAFQPLKSIQLRRNILAFYSATGRSYINKNIATTKSIINTLCGKPAYGPDFDFDKYFNNLDISDNSDDDYNNDNDNDVDMPTT
jgi:hypothetical protein